MTREHGTAYGDTINSREFRNTWNVRGGDMMKIVGLSPAPTHTCATPPAQRSSHALADSLRHRRQSGRP